MDDSPVDMSPELYQPLAPPPQALAPSVPPPLYPMEYAYPYGYAPPKKPRVWTGFVAFGVYLVLTIVVGVAIIVGQMAISGRMDLNLRLILSILAFNVIVAGSVAVAAAWFSPEPALDRLQLRLGSMSIASTLLGIVTTCAIGATFTAGIQLLTKVDALAPVFEMPDLLADLTTENPLMLLVGYLIIALGAGVGEELLFRGYIQSRFAKRMGFYGALFTSAGLFGLAHGNLVQSPFAFVMGLFVGHLAFRTGSILPAILCHIANNAMAVTLATFGFIPDEKGVLTIMLIVSFLTTVIGWFVMTRITPKPSPVAG